MNTTCKAALGLLSLSLGMQAWATTSSVNLTSFEGKIAFDNPVTVNSSFSVFAEAEDNGGTDFNLGTMSAAAIRDWAFATGTISESTTAPELTISTSAAVDLSTAPAGNVFGTSFAQASISQFIFTPGALTIGTLSGLLSFTGALASDSYTLTAANSGLFTYAVYNTSTFEEIAAGSFSYERLLGDGIVSPGFLSQSVNQAFSLDPSTQYTLDIVVTSTANASAASPTGVPDGGIGSFGLLAAGVGALQILRRRTQPASA